MRKNKVKTLLVSAIMLTMSATAGAADYHFAPVEGAALGIPTSIDHVYTADSGAAKNEDKSKNAARIPPAFGSPSAYAPDTGAFLTPNLAPHAKPPEGAVVNSSQSAIAAPETQATTPVMNLHTAVTDDLYHNDRRLGVIEIPAINLTVSTYQGTDTQTLKNGAGH